MRRDAANRRLIAVAPAFLFHPYGRRVLLDSATAGERETAATRIRRRLIMILGLLLFVALVPEFIPRDPAPEPQLLFEAAGTIQSLELHETAFSTSTTVRTADGIFQVSGAVSAKEGDVVTLKTLERPGRLTQRDVCIESTIKAACYRVKE